MTFLCPFAKILFYYVDHDISSSVNNKIHCGFLFHRAALQHGRKSAGLRLHCRIGSFLPGSNIHDQIIILVRIVDAFDKVIQRFAIILLLCRHTLLPLFTQQVLDPGQRTAAADSQG